MAGIDRRDCHFSDCRFHVICTKYHRQRDIDRFYLMDAYIENLDDENARIVRARGC